MTTYQFSLIFALPDEDDDPGIYVEALYEAGCCDATIGIGRLGMIALDFDRDASSSDAAIESAIHDVRKVIQRAKLVEESQIISG